MVNSFTLDSQNVTVSIPSKRIKNKVLRRGSKEIVKAGKKVVRTKIKTPKPAKLNVSTGNLPSPNIKPDVIEMGGRFFTQRRRG